MPVRWRCGRDCFQRCVSAKGLKCKCITLQKEIARSGAGRTQSPAPSSALCRLSEPQRQADLGMPSRSMVIHRRNASRPVVLRAFGTKVPTIPTSCELSLPDGNLASAVTGPAHLECVVPVQGEHVHLRKTQFRADRIQTHMELLYDDTAT